MAKRVKREDDEMGDAPDRALEGDVNEIAARAQAAVQNIIAGQEAMLKEMQKTDSAAPKDFWPRTDKLDEFLAALVAHTKEAPDDARAVALLDMAELLRLYPPVDPHILSRLILSPDEVCLESVIVKNTLRPGFELFRNYLTSHQEERSQADLARMQRDAQGEILLYQGIYEEMSMLQKEMWAKLGRLTAQNLTLMGVFE